MNYIFVDYIWFDYMCVPQKDYVAQQEMLLSIPYIMERSTVKPFFLDKNHFLQYQASVWCQLEYMAQQTGSKEKASRREGWTIYDVSDLYFVLPGFFDMVTSRDFIYNFIGADEQALMMLDILDLFIQYHESQIMKDAELGDTTVETPLEDKAAAPEPAPEHKAPVEPSATTGKAGEDQLVVHQPSIDDVL